MAEKTGNNKNRFSSFTNRLRNLGSGKTIPANKDVSGQLDIDNRFQSDLVKLQDREQLNAQNKLDAILQNGEVRRPVNGGLQSDGIKTPASPYEINDEVKSLPSADENKRVSMHIPTTRPETRKNRLGFFGGGETKLDGTKGRRMRKNSRRNGASAIPADASDRADKANKVFKNGDKSIFNDVPGKLGRNVRFDLSKNTIHEIPGNPPKGIKSLQSVDGNQQILMRNSPTRPGKGQNRIRFSRTKETVSNGIVTPASPYENNIGDSYGTQPLNEHKRKNTSGFKFSRSTNSNQKLDIESFPDRNEGGSINRPSRKSSPISSRNQSYLAAKEAAEEHNGYKNLTEATRKFRRSETENINNFSRVKNDGSRSEVKQSGNKNNLAMRIQGKRTEQRKNIEKLSRSPAEVENLYNKRGNVKKPGGNIAIISEENQNLKSQREAFVKKINNRNANVKTRGLNDRTNEGESRGL